MDPPQPPPLTTTTTTTTKLRLMCSYGGHIVPRPQTKILCYAGGETRIISVNRATSTNLSALTAHLTAALPVSSPFSVKYQLPDHDLDALVSLSTDDDLAVMLDELHRISTSSSSRIRLFLFSPKPYPLPESISSIFHHPKTEAWFHDALKSAKIMQRGRNCFDACGASENGADSGNSGAESIVLETSSSFGSTSSSVSSANLPPIKTSQIGDGVVSDSSVGTASAQPQVGTSSTETMSPSSFGESERRAFASSSGFQMQKPLQAPVYPQLDQRQHQHLQFVHSDAHYIPHNGVSVLSASSYYPMYHAPLHQQPLHYQPNQPYPVYLLPVGQPQVAQPYNGPVHYGLMGTATTPPCQASIHPNATMTPPSSAYEELTPELASRTYITSPEASPLGPPQSIGDQQKLTGLPQSTANCSNEIDDDLARDLIYKSQPPPPTYQTMTKATTVLLSEALAQLHTDNMKQHRTSEPL